jgi:hypothetical protein
MPIFRAVGLAIAIIVIRLLTPRIFDGFEDTLIVFFQVLKDSLALSSEAIHNTAGSAISFPRVPGT